MVQKKIVGSLIFLFSLEVPGENTSNEWLEPVDADAYEAL